VFLYIDVQDNHIEVYKLNLSDVYIKIYIYIYIFKKFKSYNSKEITNEALSFIQAPKKWSSDDTFCQSKRSICFILECRFPIQR
jgi:hypothetical protein